MGIDIVLRIAGIGILVAIICQLLKQTGRDDSNAGGACGAGYYAKPCSGRDKHTA